MKRFHISQEEIKVLMKFKNIYQKTICQFFVFLVNQDKNMVLIKLK